MMPCEAKLPKEALCTSVSTIFWDEDGNEPSDEEEDYENYEPHVEYNGHFLPLYSLNNLYSADDYFFTY